MSKLKKRMSVDQLLNPSPASADAQPRVSNAKKDKGKTKDDVWSKKASGWSGTGWGGVSGLFGQHRKRSGQDGEGGDDGGDDIGSG